MQREPVGASRAADWANVPEWQPLSGRGMRSAATRDEAGSGPRVTANVAIYIAQ